MILPQEQVEGLWSAIESDPKVAITVDLVERVVTFAGSRFEFALDDYTRWRLMEGLDDIGLTLRHIDTVADFEKSRPVFKPKTLPILN